MRPPPLVLPPNLREVLDARHPSAASALVTTAERLARPAVYIDSKRIAAAPLSRGWLMSRLRPVAAPVLSPLAGKFGGHPYAEEREDWSQHRFLGQFDLTQAGALIGQPQLRGLLRVDVGLGVSGLRVRWFESPQPSRAVAQAGVRSVGRWECQHELCVGWTLPRDESLTKCIPEEILNAVGEDWFDVWQEWWPDGYDEDLATGGRHRLLGAPVIDDYYDAVDGAVFAPLLRVDYDNIADFGWGTNWLYVLAPREELAQGELRRLLATGGNA